MEKDKSEKGYRIDKSIMEKDCVKAFLAQLDAEAVEQFWRDVAEVHREN